MGSRRLTFTPLAETMTAISEWWNSDTVDAMRRKRVLEDPAGIIAKESDVIKKWLSQ